MQQVNGGSSIPPPQQLNFHVPEVKPGAAEADIDAALLKYEQIELMLQGILPCIDFQPDDKTKLSLARTLHAFAKLLRAHVAFVREIDGASLKLNDEQRERLIEAEDAFDDVADTLDWTLQAREELRAAVSEELGR